MIVDRSEPVNLFALIPERYATLEPALQELDRLLDDVRVISRLLRRAKTVLGTGTDLGKAVFRTRNRSVRRAIQQLHRIARRKGEEAAEELTETDHRLIRIAKQSEGQAQRVEGVLPVMEQVIYQTERRVLDDEKLCATEKIVSLFEPHTQIIKRQKAGKATEFGRKLWLEEVEGGIVSGYRVLEEAGQDDRYLEQRLADHQQRFGHPSWLVTGDRGVSSPTNEQLAHEAGVRRVVLPAKGKAAETRKQLERERWFRRGFRFRAGIEGRISVLRRCYELDRCRDHGDEGMGRWVGWGIITANLVMIARTEVKRGAHTRRRAACWGTKHRVRPGGRAGKQRGAQCPITLPALRFLAILRQKLVPTTTSPLEPAMPWTPWGTSFPRP